MNKNKSKKTILRRVVEWIAIIIFFIIVYSWLFSPSEKSINTSKQNVLENEKNRIVYIIYEFTGKGEDGISFTGKASGSGVIFYKNNSMMQIFTNRHVIDCGYIDNCYQRLNEKVKVRMPDGKIYNVSKVYLASHGLDIAILTLNENDFRNYNATLIRKNEIKIGEKVTAIGYPGLPGINNVLEFSISDGTITNFRELLMKDGFSFKAIDSDVYTNHGSSGGGLFDEGGNLVGINTWIQGTQNSIAININIIDNIDSYYYCEEGSYLKGDNQCNKFCNGNEVLGSDGICYGICNNFYCQSTDFKGDDSRCKEGYIYGDDGYCHLPCGSDLTYCSSTDSICYKDNCVGKCSNINQHLFSDGTCRFYS